MNQGRVKFFDTRKGSGIIVDDRDKSEIYVHFSQIKSSAKILVENEVVSYEVATTYKGKTAINLTRHEKLEIG